MDRPSFWRQKTFRKNALQASYVIVLLSIIISATLNARANLEAQGLTSGFDFLWNSTGWDMNFAVLQTSTSDPYWWYLFVGLLNTLFMGVLGLFFASILGLIVGMMRAGRNPAGRLMGTIYIELFRNLPIILQLFFWYAIANTLPAPRQAISFAGSLLSSRGIYLPGLNIDTQSVAIAVIAILLSISVGIWTLAARRFRRKTLSQRLNTFGGIVGVGVVVALVAAVSGHDAGAPWMSWPTLAGLRIDGGIRLQPEFYALALTITTYGAAYIGEIVRGGFKAVGHGQTEAAAALGLSPWQVFSRVRLPLAFRASLPILINQYVWLIKATTLGIAVGFSDFFMVIAGSITHSGQTIEFIAILMAGFLLINFTLAAVLNRLNKAIALKGHQATGST